MLASLRTGCYVVPEAINHAIKTASTSNPDACLALLREADPEVFDEDSCRLAVRFLGLAGDWEAVLVGFERLGARKHRPDNEAVLQLLRALLHLGREREALAAYELVLGRPSSASALSAGPSGRSLPAALHAALARRNVKERLDARHHDAAMGACLGCGHWERAHTLLGAAAARRQSLAPASYEAGARLFEGAAQWQLCLWTVQACLRASVAPSPATCVATLGALGKAGEWPRVVPLLDDFQDWDVRTNAAVVNATLTALLRNGRREERRAQHALRPA